MYKFFISVLLLIFFISPVYADGVITQYYQSLVGKISQGQIVSVGGNNIVLGVHPTTSPNDNNMIGVADYTGSISVGISNTKSVPVVSSGIVNVEVSNVNGTIKSGDLITSSFIPGVGELNLNNGEILGKAIANFSYKNYLYKKYITFNGKKSLIYVEYIPVVIGISYFSNSSNFSGIILSLGKKVTGKNISFFNIILSIIIIISGIVTLIYGTSVSLKHSLLGVSRNPLSKASIEKNLLFIILSLIFIFLITLFIGYFILIF
jgi:hypothetical protein